MEIEQASPDASIEELKLTWQHAIASNSACNNAVSWSA